MKNLGLTANGGFKEFVCVKSRQVAPLPEQLSFVDMAPLMCAGYTIFFAFKKCTLPKGVRVGVIGCGGGLGNWRCNSGVRWDINSFGIDDRDATLALARELDTGAAIFDARVTQPEDVLAQLFGDEGKAR